MAGKQDEPSYAKASTGRQEVSSAFPDEKQKGPFKKKSNTASLTGTMRSSSPLNNAAFLDSALSQARP